MKALIVLVAVAVCALATEPIAEDKGVLLETRVSWLSLAQPEVHALIRNSSGRARPLEVRFGAVKCTNPVELNKTVEFQDISDWHRTWTIGVLPGNGWLHRSYPLGLEFRRLGFPCEMETTVLEGSTTTLKKTTTIPASAGLSSEDWADDEWATSHFNIDQMVEVDAHLDVLLAQVLVEYRGPNTARVKLRRLPLNCEDLTWEVRDVIFQGEDTGPDDLRSGQWTVFQIPLERRDSGSCEVRLEVLGRRSSGYEAIESLSFSPAPTSERRGALSR